MAGGVSRRFSYQSMKRVLKHTLAHLSELLLMTHFSQTLLPLVCGHFVSLAFPATRHVASLAIGLC
jgi:hypothetical protein